MRKSILATAIFTGASLFAANTWGDLRITGTQIIFPDGSTLASAGGIGGVNNTATGLHAVVAGGAFNAASGDYSAIGGGSDNEAVDEVAADQYQTIGGGFANLAQGTGSTIGGGDLNAALGSGFDNTVAGGYYNFVGDTADNTSYGSVGGGAINTASGDYSTVPGGYANLAFGHYSFAAGQNAQANHNGAFVWSDSTTQFGLNSADEDEFVARASGGFYFYTNAATSLGARLNPFSSTWQVISDRDAKDNIEIVDSGEVLSRVLEMPVQTFTYKEGDPNVRYMGVMAQDFYQAFGLGTDDKHVTEYDMAGAALASVQGLNAKLVSELEVRDAKIIELEARLAELETKLAQLATD